MTGAEFISVVLGIFKFWDSVVWLVKQLKDTPEESREKIIAKVNAQFEESRKSGRPNWD